jgi:hypothetical protein
VPGYGFERWQLLILISAGGERKKRHFHLTQQKWQRNVV